MVLASCAALSAAAVVWSWRHGAMLNYGDAVAHLHIARRVIDSHRPGLSQLGSVWLPLPHLLLIPFVAVYGWWANGIAGMIPSALAFLAACAGIYRLARRWLQPLAAAVALAFFATNPNLLYLQTTAMTEPLFLCEIDLDCRLARRMARISRNRSDPLANVSYGRSHWCWWPLSSPATTAGFWRCWPGSASAWNCFAVAASARATSGLPALWWWQRL